MPRTRPHKITLYLNDKELRLFKQQVEITGLTQTEVLRSRVLGLSLRPRPCTHHAAMMNLTASIANNVNQIARIANTTRQVSPETIRQLDETLQTLWEQVRDNW